VIAKIRKLRTKTFYNSGPRAHSPVMGYFATAVRYACKNVYDIGTSVQCYEHLRS